MSQVFCLISLFFLLSLPANSADRTDPAGGTGGGPILGELQVTVVDALSGDPVPSAFVMFGSGPGIPLPNNYGTTDAAGEIVFTDPVLSGPLTVTAGMAGYRFVSLLSLDAAELVIPIAPVAIAQETFQVGDNVSGIDVDNGTWNFGDGYLDLAFVLTTLSLEGLMNFDIDNLMGPMETIEVIGNTFEIPSNIYIPSQYEIFIEIVKDHYYLYLPEGQYTLGAMSGRIDIGILLDGGEIQDIISNLNWREIDILDVTVTGNTSSADLSVGPDLNTTAHINLDNLPEGSQAFCISAGDLDGLNGSGRLVPLGLDMMTCAAGSGGCGGTASLTTTAASGEFSGMGYHPLVAVSVEGTDEVLVLVDREDHPRDYTVNMGDFFSSLDLSSIPGQVAWNDVENASNGSPPVDMHIARIMDNTEEEIYWEFWIPGDVGEVSFPFLPAEAPAGPAQGGDYRWGHASFGLTYNSSGFDFNDFAFTDLYDHGSHMSIDELAFVFESSATAAEDVPGLFALRGNWPNPFNPKTTIRFELQSAGPGELAVYDISGRKVASLASGEFAKGAHEVPWNGCDDAGRLQTSGVYLARLQVDGEVQSHRMLLIK
ncbi:MAG: T9SS type A sorting domain-containing protein [Candidatus Krumholzibacteria bacterium]|nr:T9SS type A sorting domain-containing protein [Candidatus Krumholzibacteria bacterium]MDP6669769.1 T9SS type A sorting domain-containing protein [Candidatus Krumholzibacteria bacterium]MDP6796749.1 T9SS type A sorting domain-containing protein [Candidatus Krumholzibacteria bacterium]MDP7021697.1 T9SS type A sorting domain-containing protein [Candidatus Krumholzibacteria bacterium]